jgi:chromosome condensin MukBEF MukE localization factor
MRCLKLLGERVMSRDFDRQVAELQIRAAILNRFAALGTPITKRAGQVCPGDGILRLSADLRKKAGAGSSRDLPRHYSLSVNGEHRCEPRASELPDDIENARIIRRLPDETAQV